MAYVDLNSDLGESFGQYKIGEDEEMMKIISSANVACGFHGGDPQVMHETLSQARANGVGVGADSFQNGEGLFDDQPCRPEPAALGPVKMPVHPACASARPHPGFNDLWGFGRRRIVGDSPADIEKSLVYQIGAIQGMATSLDMRVTHYKIHGALSNMACEDEDLAMAAARAVKSVDQDLIFLVLPGSELEKAGEKLGLNVAREVFADRAYEDDGMLVSRKKDGAMIKDAAEAGRRMVRFIEDGAMQSINGKRIPVQIDSICVHGDSPTAVAMAKSVRNALIDAGIEIRPMHETMFPS